MMRAATGLAATVVIADVRMQETGEAQTIVASPAFDGVMEYTVISSREFAILKENQADHGLTPICSILPSGEIDVYHIRLAGEAKAE